MPNLKNVKTQDGTEETSVKVLYLSNVENLSKTEGKDFFKRSIGIEVTQEINGSFYTKLFEFQATGDVVKSTNQINVHDLADLKYEIKGSKFTKKDTVEKIPSNPDHIGIIMNFNLVEISVFEKAKAQDPLKNKNIPIEGMQWNEFLQTWEKPLPF